jgi:hypothetical protein
MASVARLGLQAQTLLTQTARTVTTTSLGRTITFPPTAQVIAKNPGLFGKREIKREKILPFVTLDHALMNSGSITRSFLESILATPYVQGVYKDQIPGMKIIVTATNRSLIKGENPLSPDKPMWHTDLGELKKGMIDLLSINPKVRMYTAFFSTHPEGLGNEEYLRDRISLKISNENPYVNMDEQINQLSQKIHTCELADGEIAEMNTHSVHRPLLGRNDGWRGEVRVMVIPKNFELTFMGISNSYGCVS